MAAGGMSRGIRNKRIKIKRTETNDRAHSTLVTTDH